MGCTQQNTANVAFLPFLYFGKKQNIFFQFFSNLVKNLNKITKLMKRNHFLNIQTRAD